MCEELDSVKIAHCIANALHEDIAEDGINVLQLTNIHHSDDAPYCVSVELMNGKKFKITVEPGFVP